ncbi:TonB-dependent receptor [Halioxenophilus sp. WMMB6]|uniref:TonB-dependent receptor n=1 Tax=Halioxenophilus sp. WMMB6 TaxID=3073815 RepID=UPI00295F5782|nr:TonB-dependent receptor [Halioxenophilus sp. WMMB6]
MKAVSFQLPNTTFQRSLICIALASASFGYVANVAAQQELRVLEEIVVTARRREENLQEVPVAVTAMGEDYLRNQNITELNDLGTQVPSLRVSNGGTSTNEPVISIRGQRPTDSTLGLDAAIPIYFADIVMTPSFGTNLGMYDLSNVQVLKGPQGTLFGRNSTGGALLITPKRPGTELGGYFEGKVGDFNLVSAEGAVDIPVNDNLQFRLSGRKVTRDGYQENVRSDLVNEDFWDEDSEALRLGVNFETDGFSNLLTLDWGQNDMFSRVPVPAAYNSSTNLGFLIGAFYTQDGVNLAQQAVDEQAARDDAFKIATDVLGKDKIENTVVANVTEVELTADLSFKNIFGYRNVEWNRANDADGTALPMFGSETGGLVPTFNPDEISSESEQFSDEIQLVGSAFDYAMDWIVGGYVYEMKGSQTGLVQIIAAPSPSTFSIFQSAPEGDVKNTAAGLFGEGTYNFSDQLSWTVGLRYSSDKREVTTKYRTAIGNIAALTCAVSDENGVLLPDDNCARTESETYSSPTWRTSLNYKPAEGHLLYGSISTGYRAGGINLRGFDNETLQPFDEETVITYEIGHKADWRIATVPVRSNLAIYWQDYKDIQKSQSTTAGTGFGVVTVNAAKATIAGLEFDIVASVTDNLTMSFAYSYVDAGYDEWISDQGWDKEVDLSDSDFVYIPEQTATVSVNYYLPIDPSFGDLSLSASGYWQTEMTTDETAVVYDEQAAVQNWTAENLAIAKSVSEVDGYTVFNLRADWRSVMGSAFDVALYANNVTDEEYVAGGLNVIDSLGWTAFTYGAPRTVGASVRYSF